jgi:hypothetical protein
MPPKSNIELGAGQLYFKGLDESFEVHGGEATDEVEYYDESKPYIKNVMEPITIECKDVAYPREWVLAECKYCGCKFPITEVYSILLGTKGWTCPLCAFKN